MARINRWCAKIISPCRILSLRLSPRSCNHYIISIQEPKFIQKSDQNVEDGTRVPSSKATYEPKMSNFASTIHKVQRNLIKPKSIDS